MPQYINISSSESKYPTSSHLPTCIPHVSHVSHVSFSSSVFSLLRFSRCTSTALLPLGFLAGGAVEVEGASSSVSFLFFLLLDGAPGHHGFSTVRMDEKWNLNHPNMELWPF